MTEEQIIQGAEDYINENMHGVVVDTDTRNFLLDVYLGGAHSRDKEIRELLEKYTYKIDSLIAQKEDLQEELDQLRNPWISVDEKPKKTDVYYVRTLQGCADMAYFDSSIEKWEKGRFTDGTVTQWMMVPEVKKGE